MAPNNTGKCGFQPSYYGFCIQPCMVLGRLSVSELIWQILNFVRVAVNVRKVNLLAVDRRLNVSDEVFYHELPVDVELHEFTVSVSGEQPHITLTDPEGLRCFELIILLIITPTYLGGIMK